MGRQKGRESSANTANGRCFPKNIKGGGPDTIVRSYNTRLAPKETGKGIDEDFRLSRELQEAVKGNDVEKVKTLISEGADVNFRTQVSKTTPLMIACCREFKEITEILIENGADVNDIKDPHATEEWPVSLNPGITALILAASNGDAEIVELLLLAGADKGYVGSGGFTAEGFARILYQFHQDQHLREIVNVVDIQRIIDILSRSEQD